MSDISELSAGHRLLRAFGVVAGVVLLTIAGIGFWTVRYWHKPGPAPVDPPTPPTMDPRLTYSGPFQNIHPDVAYVGDEKCAECHQDKTLSYQQHPMGRSLLPISRVAPRQRYDVATHNPFEALGTLFLVERQGERAAHRQVGRDDKGDAVYELDMPVDYVLGSGTRGYSYLTDRDGYVLQSPVSWFTQEQIWDKSPGFSVALRSGRPVVGMCLFCHANRTRPLEGHLNRYEEPLFDGYAIGCERCHGPGERHVKDPGRKGAGAAADHTIVNPHHLTPELRSAVCEQCHLIGEARVVPRGRSLYDFRPGLPLAAFLSIYVHETDPKETSKAVTHVEQMYLSRCFLKSTDTAQGKRKLGCTSCHDPHQYVEAGQRVAHYRQRCLDCHQQQGCSVPEATRRLTSKEDSCIDCHMPRFPPADIAHTSATDHRILRRKERDPTSAANDQPGPPRTPGIVSFYPDHRDLNDPEARRDLGIALSHIRIQNLSQRKAPMAGDGDLAIDLLEAAVRNDPEDLPAWEAMAEALALRDRTPEALTAYEYVLSKAPRREASLMGAAMLAQQQRLESALSYWRRAVAVDPWKATYRSSLAKMLAERKDWDEALPECAAWVRLDPANIDARVLLVTCLARTGDKTTARAEFAKIERLRPPNLPLLQARFSVELRSR